MYKDHKEKLRKQAEYRSTHKAELYAQARKHRQEQRKECIDHYGGCCECCGESRIEFLAIDHINGGGTKQRNELNIKGSKVFTWLKLNNFPTGFRVLCHNCNSSFGHYGYCPHQGVV